MNRLLALLLFVPSLCLAQVPDYVPLEGLVAWYPFNGNANDESGNGNDGDAQNTTATVDRNGFENAALEFNGIEGSNGSSVVIDHLMLNIGQEEYTIHLWFRPENTSQISRALFNTIPHTGIAMTYNNNNSPNYVSYLLGPADGMWNYYYVHGPFNDYQTTEWYAVTLTKEGTDYKQYINGVLESYFSAPLSASYNHDVTFRISGISADWQIFNGDIDDVGFWNRALTGTEIQTLFSGEAPEYGCTDQEACNYYDNANVDDGSCEYGCLYCGEGTVWDSTSTQCISIADTVFIEPEACTPSCGEGTVWDPVNEECIIAIPADLNYDGCVSVNDLLVLLAVHGTCPPYPEWPDVPTDDTWTCGDLVTYWDYDYATVLIGDQCWFAENLQATSYADGTEIPEVTDNEDWTDLTTGAHCSYANDSGNVAVYGLLYNWFAVQDMHGLCPSGWHVPTDGEWTGLENHIGSQGFIGNEGTALKSTSGWSNNGNGTDQFGWTGLPGGDRWYLNGSYFSAGTSGAWWSSSSATPSAWRRRLFDIQSNVDRAVSDDLRNGFSVRCLKD